MSNAVAKMRARLNQLNTAHIHNYMTNMGPFDSRFQKQMQELIQALIAENNEHPGTIKYRLPSLTHITRSMYTLGDSYSIAAVKVDDDLDHEYQIGMGVINLLRAILPNFRHTYGVFEADPPVTISDHGVITWGYTHGDNKQYLVMEEIHNGVTLRSHLRKHSHDFLNIYLQCLNALNVAHSSVDFTHYDLHTSNIMIQTFNHDISLPFYMPNGTMQYLQTRTLVRILDYEFSHGQVDKHHYGRAGFEHLNIYSDKSFPMYDAYKLLLSCYDTISDLPVDVSLLKTIHKFFEESLTLDERLQLAAGDPDDCHSPSLIHLHTTYDQLITWIMGKFELPFITPEQNGIDVTTPYDEVDFYSSALSLSIPPTVISSHLSGARPASDLIVKEASLWHQDLQVCEQLIQAVSIPPGNGDAITMDYLTHIISSLGPVMSKLEDCSFWLNIAKQYDSSQVEPVETLAKALYRKIQQRQKPFAQYSAQIILPTVSYYRKVILSW